MDWTPIKVFAKTILSYFSLSIRDNKISQIYMVAITVWTNLFPFRTEKLNALVPMVLP